MAVTPLATLRFFWLVLDYGIASFGPAAPAAIHRDHVGIAHFLQAFGCERGAEAAAAIENDRRAFIRDGFLDIAFDDAFAEVNGVGNVSAGPFAFLAGVHQDDRLAGVELFLRGLNVFFLDALFGFGYQPQETFRMIWVAHNFTSLEEKHNTENTEKDSERGAGWGNQTAEAHRTQRKEKPEPENECSAYFMSRQLQPTLVSATTGTLSSCTPSITSFTSLVRRGISFSGPSNSNSSWTCRIIRDLKFSSGRRRSSSIMASLIRSAAAPCIGVFIAVRSAKLRKLSCGELISGIWRIRPKRVLVTPVLRVSAIWRSRKSFTPR